MELTKKGLEEVDEIVDVQVSKPLPAEKVIIPKEERPKAQQEFNARPEVAHNGFKLVTKSHLNLMFGLIIFLILSILALGIWFNISYSSKQVANNFTIENNNEINPTIPVNVENNITVQNYGNYTLSLPKELSDALMKVLNKSQNSS